MEQLKYALIGCGRIAPNHIAAALSSAEKLDFCAVCDVIPENMESLLSQSELPEKMKKSIRRYTDYEELLKTEKPQLVAIATESGKHAAIALACIKAGCHLMIEKPLALSIADADEMIAAAKEKGVYLSACHQNRFNKSIQKIRNAVETNRFGRLFYGTAQIRWNRGEDYYIQAPWRGTWEQDGGALMNQCIHNIDLLLWMMNSDVAEVFSYTDRLNHPYIDAEDLGIALIKFKNGSYGIIEGTTDIYPKNLEETLTIFGEKGTVKAGGKSVNIIEEWLFADNLDVADEVKETYAENPPNVYGFGHTPLYADVISAIQQGREPYVNGESGKKALEVILAIYKSAKEGLPVRLPLTNYSTMDMKNHF